MVETKKVIATVNDYNQDEKYGRLVAEGITPEIHFNHKILKEKKSQNLNPKKGDKFEVEIQTTTFKGKPSWNIVSIKALKEVMKNFAIHLHKRNRFYEDDVIVKEVKSDKKKDENKETSSKTHDKFEIKKINVSEHQIGKEKENNRTGEFKEKVIYTDISEGFAFEEMFFKKLVSRHEQNALQITDNQLATGKTLQFKPDWRLVIGLGGGSVFETSITLHHIYGFPYLPASAIKGVLRSYLVSLIWGNNPDSEAIAFRDSKLMCDIFGCGKDTLYDDDQDKKKRMPTYYKKVYDEDHLQFGNEKSRYRFPEITEKMGDVIFFDAYPIESPSGKIKADIMNPHYPKYYNGNLPPADWQSPVPIIFLTVEDLTFQFMIGLRKGVANFDMSLGETPTFKGKILDLLPNLLRMALTEKGIGAKTAVGYGYMQG